MTPKLYKASEVCEATGVQPYVLRSWEKEFPGIGVQKALDSPRLYRQSDLDQVLRIKQLVFVEGLTLAGARRRLEEESPRSKARTAAIADEVLDTLGADARSRIELVRTGLRSILQVLSKRAGMATVPELPRNGSRSSESALRAVNPTNGRSAASAAGRSRTAAKPAKAASTPKRASGARKAKAGKRKRTSA